MSTTDEEVDLVDLEVVDSFNGSDGGMTSLFMGKNDRLGISSII